MNEHRDRKKRRDGSPHRSRLRKKELKQTLEDITEENIGLQETVNVLESEQREVEQNVKLLEREMENLKESISNLKFERAQEEKHLRNTVKYLKAELFDLGVPSNTGPIGGKKYHDNNKRFEMKVNRREDVYSETVSDVGVPVYRHKSRSYGRPRRKSDTRRDKRRVPPVTRRMSTPLPVVNELKHQRMTNPKKKVIYTFDEVDAAARAFLDIFRELTPKVMWTLWENNVETRTKDELVLYIGSLSTLLHRLVIYAFKQDNPGKPTPSSRRTQPLVSLLVHRLAPYTQNRRYLKFEEFLKFPRWLEQREEVRKMKPPISFSKQNSLKPISEDDARRSLKAGSLCLIWSDGGNQWCEGEVTNTKYDSYGEWLVVRYYSTSKWLEKDVQRFSDLIRTLPNSGAQMERTISV